MAKAMNKPFYVVAESFKFVRLYPLNQDDLPNDEKVTHTTMYIRSSCTTHIYSIIYVYALIHGTKFS